MRPLLLKKELTTRGDLSVRNDRKSDLGAPFIYGMSVFSKKGRAICYDMGQNDTIGKIELKPSIVLSSDNTNCKNDIQLFHQLFDELSVYRDYH